MWRKAIIGFIRLSMPKGDDRIDGTHPTLNTEAKILKLWTAITMCYYRAFEDKFAYVTKPFAPEPTPPSVGEYDFPSIKDFYDLEVSADGKTVIYEDKENIHSLTYNIAEEKYYQWPHGQELFDQEPYVSKSVMFCCGYLTVSITFHVKIKHYRQIFIPAKGQQFDLY